MKVGILTYHSTRNCGAVLQAYALQNTLNRLSLENEIIDYKCEKIENAYVIKKIWQLKSIKELIKWMLSSKTQKKAQKEFDNFKCKSLKISKPYYKNDIACANEVYDGVITGSDQVWNFNLNGEDSNYLLSFLNKDKIRLSYAASMGYSEIPEKYISYFNENLKHFSGISVRETEAKTNLDKLGFLSTLVLDPTLLLCKDDYKSLFDDEKKGDYIFVYTVANTPNIEKKAKELSKQTGYPIIWGHMSYKNKKGVKNFKNPSCKEFLNLINNAKYVLTSSFHGMALSIVFKKQFFYDLDVGKVNNNSRLTTLSSLLKLENREMNETSKLLEIKPIDYNEVDVILENEKKKSIDFLKTGLGI